jgi:hypothetical protein
MPANAYHFVSRWRVEGTVEEVADILDDAQSLGEWWGSVYSNVRITDSGDSTGLGKSFRLNGKGWLPYTLDLTFHKTEERYPNGFAVAVSGDLNGNGEWTLEQDAESVNVTFDWTVSADKPVLRWFSPAFRPVFASNHRWTMRQGEESLKLELLRRRASSEAERALIPPPPEPFAMSPIAVAVPAGAVAVLLAAIFLGRHGRVRASGVRPPGN